MHAAASATTCPVRPPTVARPAATTSASRYRCPRERMRGRDPMKGDRIAADSALTALAPLVWGSTYLVTTELLPSDRPLLAATLRALPAGLILLAIGRTLPCGNWWWRATVLGTLNIGAFLYLLFVAAYHLPGGVAALVMAVQPTVVLVLSALLLKERITLTHAAACALGVAGVGLLALTPGAGLDAVGVGAGLLGAVSMATGVVLTKRWGRPPGVGLLTFTGWQLTAAWGPAAARHAARRGAARVGERAERRRLRVPRPGRRASRLRGVVPGRGTAARADRVRTRIRVTARGDGARLRVPGRDPVPGPAHAAR